LLFGTLHVHRQPDALARAFTHSAELALLTTVGLVTLALALVLALPHHADRPGIPTTL
jgi:hypothetical protein